MKRTTRSVVNVALIVGLLSALAAGPSTAAETIRVRLSFAAPTVTAPLVLSFKLYRVTRDSSGQYQKPEPAGNSTLTVQPGDSSQNLSFEADLDVGREYQLDVDVVSESKKMAGKTYYLAWPDMTGQFPEKRLDLEPGKKNTLYLSFRLADREAGRANFLSVVSAASGYQLALYFNPSAVEAK